ncbi:MAG: terminase gpA endonuclease subunit [Taibaiella sp.]|jgi:phage terminase large subunit GpA-like protein
MMDERVLYFSQFENMFEDGLVQLSDIKPSDWVEQNVVVPDGAFPGPFRYALTPYTREIIDCLAPDHPARWVAVMKGAQLGFSAGILIPGIGWLIANQPGNTFLTVGAPDLIEKAMEKLDLMIDNSGLRPLIKPNVQRNRANKSGDTNSKKEFPGGYVTVASAGNHKAIRQVDLMYGFFDDFESVKSASKESGDTKALLDQRFAAYANKHKIFYISTPEVKETSNIEPAYEMGDQRKYMVPCQCCASMIEIRWSVIKDNEQVGGIIWETDENGHLVQGSVGYKCQECGETFTDANKTEMLNSGYWMPTSTPSKPGFFSYHISSLYAPPGMYNWEYYVNLWIEAHPKGQPRNETKYQTFVNTCLGETYVPASESPKANSIQTNTRSYQPGTVPEMLSIADGNGPIRLLTCSVDMNGKPDDARLDFEILAWADSGANYSVLHGSIGTFIPLEGNAKVKVDRVHWTYDVNKPNSVWPELEKILSAEYMTDADAPRAVPIFQSGLDCGHFSKDYAYPFLDRTTRPVVGLKGDKESGKPISLDADKKSFKPAQERPNLYILQVGLLKDDLSSFMQLRWDGRSGDPQPQNFMNYPEPSAGLYGFNNYFAHYEAEQRVMVKMSNGTTASRWEKKTSAHQNHMWDCRVYNLALRDIVIDQFAKALKLPKMTWRQLMDVLYPNT